MGNPANFVALLANMLYEEKKEQLKKGFVIWTGGITETVLLKKGDHVITDYEGMDEISFNSINNYMNEEIYGKPFSKEI